MTRTGPADRRRSTMRLAVGAHGYEVDITREAREGGDLVGHRRWQQRLPR